MSKSRVISCAKVTLIICNVIFMLTGIGMIVSGIWLHVDRSLLVSIRIAQVSPHGNLVHALTHSLIASGICITILAFLGCCGACCESVCMLVSYTTLLTMIIVTESIGAIFVAVLKRDLVNNIESRMFNQVFHEYNRTDNTTHDLTLAWDLMQVKLNCCGARGPQDYSQSYWFNNTQVREGTFVPPTCCVLLNDDPISPHIYEENQCQIDSILYPRDLEYSTAVHTRGCHPALMQWLGTRLIYFIIGSTFIGVLQVMVLLFACCLFSRIRAEQTKYPWYDMVGE